MSDSADSLVGTLREVPAPVASQWRVGLAWSSYWIIMGSSFALTAWLTQESVLGATGWYVMAQANVLIVALFEWLVPRNPQDTLFRDRQSWNDILHMVSFKLLWRPLCWAGAFAVVTYVSARWPHTKAAWPTSLPGPVQFLLLLLLFDLVGYAYHRALHRFDLLFAFHALHHDTPKLHVLKSNRLHFGESVLNFMMLVPAMILLGCPANMVIWLGMYEVFEGNLAHSNVDQRFPRWFHYLVRTADVHRIHHSVDDRLQRSNFGGLPVWDLVFGTYRHPFYTPRTRLGVGDYGVPKGFFAQLVFPFAAALRSWRSRQPAAAQDPAGSSTRR